MKIIRNEQEKKYKKDPKTLLKSLFTPFEIYVVSSRINDVENGIYHYNLKDHSLEEIKKGTFNREMSLIAHGEMFLDNAAFIIIITGVFPRYMFRYRYSRAYKELLMTCSQLAHYIILYATLMEIKTFETPALLDSWLTKLFSLEEGKEDGLYLLGFGK
jgi:SagB-type dehydrogenase family enzyme